MRFSQPGTASNQNARTHSNSENNAHTHNQIVQITRAHATV